ncbi:MAG: glycosyltransferase family 4 protein [Verrucomicrobiota bacterium]|nr:glycosyltransferase family 4 protein [Verrucomicrobiota bacterium]
MVLLFGNYAPDRQQSMQRFSAMMLQGLTAAGVPAELIAPKPLLGTFGNAGGFIAKWLAYIDKFFFFPRQLKRRLARGASIVHICDHSNAMYAAHCGKTPVVTTCHDLLAVRGALGEDTDCPASATGRILQRWILRGLARADAIACDSEATRDDAERLVRPEIPALSVITLGLNYPFRKLAGDEVARRLEPLAQVDATTPFVLSVGSNLRRKNRDGVLRIFALTKDRWDGQLVFAGDPLTPELKALAEELGVAARVVAVANPDDATLEALYNRATALVYPSRFEGFGWPIAEAQACGCPVICANRAPLPEVGGDAALTHPVDDEEAFAADILRLADEAERERWSAKSLRNAERFATERMITQYLELYRSVGAAL